MDCSEYLVHESQKQWWVTMDGFRRGPYISRQAAIESAISAAKTDFKGGKAARVAVENIDGFETLYDSSGS